MLRSSFQTEVRLLPHSVCPSFGCFGAIHYVSQLSASPTSTLTVLPGHSVQPALTLP